MQDARCAPLSLPMAPPAMPAPMRKRVGGAPFARWPSSNPAQTQAPKKAGPPMCARGSVLPCRGLAATAARGFQSGAGSEPLSARTPRSSSDRPPSPTALMYGDRASTFVQQLATGNAASEWTVVQEMEAVANHMSKLEERRQAAGKKAAFRERLRSQQEEQRQREASRRQEAKAWADFIKQDSAAYHQEEAEKKAAHVHLSQRFNEDSQRDLEERERRKQAQRQAEEQMMEDISRRQQEAARKADEKEARAKREERERAAFLAEAARQARVDREERRQQDAKEDRRRMKEATELAEKKEQQRRDEQTAKLKRIEEQMSRYEAGVREGVEKQQRLDEERARRQQQELLEKELANEHAKKNRLQALRHDAQMAQRDQMAEHQRQRADEREERRRLGEVQQRAAEAWRAEQQAELMVRRRREQAVAAVVKSQIEEVAMHAPEKRESMTEVERKFNKEILERAKDPMFMQAMLQRRKQEYVPHSAR